MSFNFWNIVSSLLGWRKPTPPPVIYSTFDSGGWRTVLASSFADPADIAAFKRCKAQGKTDRECFKVGDNGIGCWGDDTTKDRPMCALPPEDWKILDHPRGALVDVRRETFTITCELRDTMPKKQNIRNGAGIDLNPAACAALHLTPPVLTSVKWRWHTN